MGNEIPFLGVMEELYRPEALLNFGCCVAVEECTLDSCLPWGKQLCTVSARQEEEVQEHYPFIVVCNYTLSLFI